MITVDLGSMAPLHEIAEKQEPQEVRLQVKAGNYHVGRYLINVTVGPLKLKALGIDVDRLVFSGPGFPDPVKFEVKSWDPLILEIFV